MLLAGAILAVSSAGELLPSPDLGVRPLLFGEAAFDVGERARQGEFPLADRSIRVCGGEPFDTVGVRLVCGEFCPFVGDLVPLDPLVAREPPDLDLDVRFFGAEGCDVPPGFEGVLLPWSRVVGRHPPDGRLRVREDGGRSNRVVPGGRHLEGSSNRGALSVEGFLAPAHVGLMAFPACSLLPCNRVAGRSVLKARSVRENR